MNSPAKRIFNSRNIFITVLVVACVAAAFLYSTGVRHFYHTQIKPVLSRQPSRPSEIEPWMTFRYINVVFRLPPDYLKEKLSITDSRYPNVSLARYAKTNHITATALTQQVQKAISELETK